jgi:hypothetical protein
LAVLKEVTESLPLCSPPMPKRLGELDPRRAAWSGGRSGSSRTRC